MSTKFGDDKQRKTPNNMKLLLSSMSNDQQKKYTKLSGSEIELAISSLEAWSIKDSKTSSIIQIQEFRRGLYLHDRDRLFMPKRWTIIQSGLMYMTQSRSI